MVALAAVIGVWTRSPAPVAAVAIASVVVGRRAIVLVACLVIGLAGGWRSQVTWTSAVPSHLGDYAGWATVVGDPAPFGSGLRVTIEIEGERFDAWVYGSPRRRLVDRQAGELVYVQGERRADDLQRSTARRSGTSSDVRDRCGRRLERRRLRCTEPPHVCDRALRGVAESTMDADDAALYAGLVIGDDARRAGRDGHRVPASRTVAPDSGLRRERRLSDRSGIARCFAELRPWWRWATTLGLIGWFMVFTRFEPSVLRAGIMAMLGSSAFVLGRRQSVVRLLACTVAILVLVDPMLVWSVGFWLSTGATAGVCVVAPPLAQRFRGRSGSGPRRRSPSVRRSVSPLPSWLVFHRLPLVVTRPPTSSPSRLPGS